MPFEEIYKQNYKVVYGYLFNLCKDDSLAEELTAETFYKAFRSFSRFRGESKLSTWLCQIAKNEFRRYVRKNKRDHYILNVEFPDDSFFEERIQDRDTAIRLHKLLRELDEPYKETFMLRVFAELSFYEIGQVTGKTENWARVTFYRAKIKLKQQMEDSDE